MQTQSYHNRQSGNLARKVRNAFSSSTALLYLVKLRRGRGVGGGMHPHALASLVEMALGVSVGFFGIGQSN